jgi:hypothetical protein
MRLVAYGEETPGWLDTGEREDGNVSRALGARGGLSIEAGDGWRADATGLGQWLHARDSNYSYQLGSDSRPAQLPEPHSNDLVHGSLRVAREGPTQIVLSTGYTVHDVDDRYDATRGSERLAEQIEGLTVTGEGSGHGRMFLRGVADSPFGGKSQSTVAVLLDDARLTYVAPDPDIRLVDVERVEVLKGPQGSLYGSGALGGIYRIVTRRADPSAFTVAGSASGEIVADGVVTAEARGLFLMPSQDRIAELRDSVSQRS